MKKKTFLFPILALLLVACSGGGGSSSDIPSSSDPSSSQVSSSDASTGSQSLFTSSETPPSEFNNASLAVYISSQAVKYDPDSTASFMIEEAKRLDASFSEIAVPTNASFALLSYAAFAKKMPSKRGARGFEFYDNPANPAFTGYEEGSVYLDAFRFLSDAGIIDASSFDPSFEVNESLAWTYLDRFHYYYSSSPVDDFFAYANYDQRISDCVDEGASSTDASLNQINVASVSAIVEWSKGQIIDNHDAYLYYHAATTVGESNLLSPMIEDYMAATSPSDLLEKIISSQSEYGYSPLYQNLTFSLSASLSGKWTGRVYSAIMNLPFWMEPSSSLAEGTAAYSATVETYAPLFSYLLDDEAEGKTRATDYADFRYEVALSLEKHRPDYQVIYEPDTSYGIGNTGKTFGNVLDTMGIASDYSLCTMVNYKGFFDLFVDEHLEELKAYIIWALLAHYRAPLPDTELFNDFIGYPERHDDDNYFYSDILVPIAANVCNDYIESDEYKADVNAIIKLFNDLRTVFGEKIDEASWLSEEGKAACHEKLDAMRCYVGINTAAEETLVNRSYPENAYRELPSTSSILDYEALYARSVYAEGIAKLGTAPEDYLFDLITRPNSGIEPNAYYLREHNAISYMLGMMICNIGAGQMNYERLLATFGLTMAHEIGHGFDAMGFTYNKDGAIDPAWISQEDQASFAALVGRYSEYIDGYEALPGYATNGQQVIDEAVADNIGLSLTLALGEMADSFDQAVYFREIAKFFGGYISRAAYEKTYASDSHPAQRARVNRLFSSSTVFHDAYGVKEGDHMYVAPENRIRFY